MFLIWNKSYSYGIIPYYQIKFYSLHVNRIPGLFHVSPGKSIAKGEKKSHWTRRTLKRLPEFTPDEAGTLLRDHTGAVGGRGSTLLLKEGTLGRIDFAEHHKMAGAARRQLIPLRLNAETEPLPRI